MENQRTPVYKVCLPGTRKGLLGKSNEQVLEQEARHIYNEIPKIELVENPEKLGPERKDDHYDLTRLIE
ncbi:MAG: hypothetical protein WCK90_02520 [archaeon]